MVQQERFEAQVALTAAGDEHAMPLDEDFGNYDGVWNASEWRHGNTDRPAAHDVHRFGYRDAMAFPLRTTTMGGLISHFARKWANLLVVVVESSCDGSLHYVPEGGRRAWRRRSP